MNVSEYPVIIGGVERSGTSLLRAILGSHSDLAVFQWDLPLWRQFYKEFGGQDLSLSECKDLLRKISAHRKAVEARMTPDAEYVLQVLGKKTEPVKCEHVFGAYLQAYAKKRSRKRWGLKTPTNEFYARSIFREFPKATLIHVIRDPRDIIVSMMKTDFMKEVRLSLYPHKFKDGNILDWWNRSVRVGIENKISFGNRYQIIKYENIVNNPKKYIKKLCNYSDLEYEKSMLKMEGHPGWSGSNSEIDNDSRKCVRDNTGRYKKYLKNYQVDFIERRVGKMMNEYGYELEMDEGNTYKGYLLNTNYFLKNTAKKIKKLIK